MKDEIEIQNAITQYADMVQRICFLHKLQPSDVDDIFQNVFLKYAQSASFQDSEHEKAWILRVTINTCNDTWRSWFHRKVHLSEEIETYPSKESSSNSYVLDAVKALPEQYRNVIYLFYYEGYKVREIALLLHKKENTIHTWLRRAKEQLKDVLGGDDFA